MDDLSTRLRAASDGAPPTGIDLDALIAGEGRRRTRWAVASAAAVASVLVLTGLSVALPDRARPRTVPVAPIPAVTAPEPCVHASLPASVPDRAAVVPRLGPPPETTEVAVRRLTAALPGLLPPGAHPGPRTRCARVEFYYERKALEYRATAWVGADEYSLAVSVKVAPAGVVPHCLNDDDPSCTRIDGPDGSVAMADLVGVGTPFPQRSVTVYRPDGTIVLLAAIGRRAGLPTASRLAAIGRAPGLTLYP